MVQKWWRSDKKQKLKKFKKVPKKIFSMDFSANKSVPQRVNININIKININIDS